MQLGRPARPSRPEIWLPKLRRAIKTFGGAGAVEDAWVWLLKAPGAAWHRGEDGKGPDRTQDFATLLSHPDYAEKRDWKGPLGPTRQLYRRLGNQNLRALNAPVKAPHMWYAGQYDWVQTNGSIRSPLHRNVGAREKRARCWAVWPAGGCSAGS